MLDLEQFTSGEVLPITGSGEFQVVNASFYAPLFCGERRLHLILNTKTALHCAVKAQKALIAASVVPIQQALIFPFVRARSGH